MEGHLLSALTHPDPKNASHFSIRELELPILGLLISGGHTELVVMKEWLSYNLVGATKDDAVGEAYDKVARMLQLPYPGGPEISKLAELARDRGNVTLPHLPRPMMKDATCDFSFSGLKTAVLYLIKDRMLTDTEKEEIAHSFEEAVADVLYSKTSRALYETGAKTLVLGGGVSANTHLRRVFAKHCATEHPEVTLYLPAPRFTTDNAIMIGIAGFYRALKQEFTDPAEMRANGNRSIT
jgi:N6-L-threonylcarbamoyladenine synthase